MMPTFGKRRSERPNSPGANGSGRDHFIKTFKNGNNRVRFLEDDPANWVDIQEHYDRGLNISYPCAAYDEPGSDCIGCRYPVEHEEYADLEEHFPGMKRNPAKEARKKLDKGWGVRDTRAQWLFPIIDPEGYISIFKAGYNFWEEMKGHYEVLGSIVNTEFVIKRQGEGFDTTTQAIPVPGEVREPKYPVPGQDEISVALGKKYSYALEKYGFEPQEDFTSGPDEAQAGPPPAGNNAPDESAKGFIPREASAGEIKDWLDNQNPPVEYPAKAPRGVLVGLAEKKLTELAGEPPF